MPKALSATIPDPLEARTRVIARLENRSLSNVVENALNVFTSLPKDLRDELIARIAANGPDDTNFQRVSRRLLQILAQERLDQALDGVAGTIAADPVPEGADAWLLDEGGEPTASHGG